MPIKRYDWGFGFDSLKEVEEINEYRQHPENFIRCNNCGNLIRIKNKEEKELEGKMTDALSGQLDVNLLWEKRYTMLVIELYKELPEEKVNEIIERIG